MASVILPAIPSESRPGRFGVYGGRYVPETLMAALVELEHEYEIAKADAAFQAELHSLLTDYAGRPIVNWRNVPIGVQDSLLNTEARVV